MTSLRLLRTRSAKTARDSIPTLQAYFASGWAFFLPYLALYLLYCWLDWPVQSDSGKTLVPSLVATYWTLHAFHVTALASVVTKCWLVRRNRDLATVLSDAVLFLPWLFLGLLVGLPGLSWEYPNDTWEHFVRINDWAQCSTVSEHSSWTKFSYFLAYHFVYLLPPLQQQAGLQCFYTIISLLFFWQHFRLVRSFGLRPPTAFLAVLLLLICGGNSAFAFHRYYGLASTLIAQIAFLAFTRGIFKQADRCFRDSSVVAVIQKIGLAIGLTALMGFSHTQTLAMAIIAAAAAGGWKLAQHPCARLWSIFGLVAITTAFAIGWDVAPTVSGAYRAAGWISSWYGFNLLSFDSPAALRTMEILGAVGMLNLVAGLWLIIRNNPVGWLTLAPLLALLWPPSAVPLAEMLATRSSDSILAFHRLLLGVPVGVALLITVQRLVDRWCILELRSFGTAVLPSSFLLFLVAAPPGTPVFNRYWHAVTIPAADLSMAPIVREISGDDARPLHEVQNRHFLTTTPVGFVARATGVLHVVYSERIFLSRSPSSPAERAKRAEQFLHTPTYWATVVFAPAPLTLYSPASQAAIFSRHWLPSEVALGFSTSPQLAMVAEGEGELQCSVPAGYYFLIPDR